MEERKFIIVLVLCAINLIDAKKVLCAINLIDAKKELKYAYEGEIVARNRASDEAYSKWNIISNLYVQEFKDRTIFKLENVKTSLFNGLKTMNEPEFKVPIENIEELVKPFAVYYKRFDDVEMTVYPEEKTWSANMKRSIASIFNVIPRISNGSTTYEPTIYGNCETVYQVFKSESVNKRFLNKVINHDNCTEEARSEFSNVETASLNNKHKKIQYETERYYQFEHKDGGIIELIEAQSNITYQNMPAVRATHHLEQIQKFKFMEQTDKFAEFEIPSDVQNVSLIWDSNESEEEVTKTQEDIFEDYANALKEFKDTLKVKPLVNTDIMQNDTVQNMFEALQRFNETGMELLTNSLDDNDRDDWLILLSLLPYVGTEESVALVGRMIKIDLENDLLLIKLLATFPHYVNVPSRENVKNFKFLTNLHEINNTQVRHAGILSYASLLADTYDRSWDLGKKFMNNVIKRHHNKLIQSDDYEEQMTNMLALINLGNCMNEKRIIDIITDQNISPSLRTLASFGFKKYLSNPEKEDVFNTMWPIVQNISENFEVRVAALDLLLSTTLTEEEFNTIVNTYEKKPENPYEEHMTNYVFTSIESLENSTGYQNNLANFATERLKKGNIPRYTRSWTTGNYRVAFSDDQANYGSSFHARLIGTPITNGFDVLHLSYDHFEMSLVLESYTLYIKLGGVYDNIFKEIFLERENNDPIAALVELIKKCEYKLKSTEDIRIDIAVFNTNKAVFGFHINKNNIDSFSDNPLFVDFVKLYYYTSISFPVLHVTTMPSDLGTKVQITEEIVQVFHHETDFFEELFEDDIEIKDLKYHYRSQYLHNSILACTNPLTSTNIISYSQRTDEKALDLPIKINSTSLTVSIKIKDDIFNWVAENSIVLSQGEEQILKQYCAECEEYYVLPTGPIQEDVFERYGIDKFEPIGLHFNLTRSNKSAEQINLNNMDPRRGNIVQQIQNNHRSVSFAFPPARPILYLLDWMYYMRTIDELDSMSLRIGPAFKEEYETNLEFFFNGDSITKDNNPLDGAELEISASLKHQKPNGDVLGEFNTTFKTVTTVRTTGDESKPHVKNTMMWNIDMFKKDEHAKICLKREMLYPNKRSDKLSLKPVKPAKGEITFAWGDVKSTHECPEQYIKFTELYTATDIQNSKAEESTDYKKCKEESNELKYVPPTEACISAHEALSKYDIYGIYADFTHAKNLQFLEENMEKTKLGYKVLEYNQIEKDHINISINSAFADYIFDITNPKLLEYEENSPFVDFLSVDPTAVAYDDYDINAGLSSTCIISPSTIKTLFGVHEPVFNEKPEEIVAYVECIENTRAGLIVHRVNNKAIGFKWWSGENLLTATIDSGKLKIELNGNEIKHTPETQNKDFKIHFLEDNVIYAVDDIVEIYYTTEYISIKAPTAYIKYICGKCSYEHKK